ncbi:MAG TPA: tagatose 1,6-diphosphate aldolase [Ktedonobacteraceae bacterium]|jgi:tagatose 1,6-diphosphate aldolase|nr:tagatose 1,6-diphosphate aldolase [Ktedonobacteraceae bacterium]
MAKIKISKGKFAAIQACMNERGTIAALAMDQRSSLKRTLEKAGATSVTDATLAAFKQTVTSVLTRYASAVLLDPEYSLSALETRAPGTGVLLSYERSGYDPSVKGRLPALLTHWSVRRLAEAGANAVKVLLYYNPFDEQSINDQKHAFIERVGAECASQDVAFFLEPLAYDDNYDILSADFARVKPEYVTAIMREFSRARYGVDLLKVEIPINTAYLAGSKAYKGDTAVYDYATAQEHFRTAAAVAEKPFLYLSAGVNDDVFRESLEMAAEAGVSFSGVLCGRATWKDGIPIFVQGGATALEAWLLERGVQNIQALNETLATTTQPWYSIYGGLENIEIV